MATPLAHLKNLGPTIVKRLNAVNIYTKEDLERIGPAATYKRMRSKNPGKTLPVCYYLYSLEGALRNVHWDALSKKEKDKLLSKVQ